MWKNLGPKRQVLTVLDSTEAAAAVIFCFRWWCDLFENCHVTSVRWWLHESQSPCFCREKFLAIFYVNFLAVVENCQWRNTFPKNCMCRPGLRGLDTKEHEIVLKSNPLKTSTWKTWILALEQYVAYHMYSKYSIGILTRFSVWNVILILSFILVAQFEDHQWAIYQFFMFQHSN